MAKVSTQYISPTSGEPTLIERCTELVTGTVVSTQYISPTSGEGHRAFYGPLLVRCFHSIHFPNEWGDWELLTTVTGLGLSYLSFHSIHFPNEWGEYGIKIHVITVKSFHSIHFPNEWGAVYLSAFEGFITIVSTQYISPTSGELILLPGEGRGQIAFPLNTFPQRVGRVSRSYHQMYGSCFHSIHFPNEWGVSFFLLGQILC
jgi:hypothetical protein